MNAEFRPAKHLEDHVHLSPLMDVVYMLDSRFWI